MKALAPFSNARYRVLVIALIASLFGGGVWLVALVFQLIDMGGGPAQLSGVAAAASLGLIGAVLLGGVTADRIPQKRILLMVEAAKFVTIGTGAFLGMTGTIEFWHLVVIALLLGVADGFFYPAYSAILPAILPADQLLAANGVEGVLRPTVMQAIGPAVASLIIAIASPAAAFAVVAAAQLLAVVALCFLRAVPLRREVDPSQHPFRAFFADLGGGFAYMVKTRWVFATLLFATILVLAIMGPIEVLLPFAVRQQIGQNPGNFAAVLAAFGIGGAVGSFFVASRRLPRRYLTVMTLARGLGSLPLAFVGLVSMLWVMIVLLFIVGFTFSAASVIWGTLLQRRVPAAMLGRISSLDFFVSLALMPVSMALAGPVGEKIGIPAAFMIAGIVPVIIAVITIWVGRFPKDELDHPLDLVEEHDGAIESVVADDGAANRQD
jgi:MFS family permease